MPPSASIQNKHLKLLATSWLCVAYCEMLNCQPYFASGSLLGINCSSSSSIEGGTSSTVSIKDAQSARPEQHQPLATTTTQPSFVYGGLFDAMSLSEHRPPLPPDMLMAVKHIAGVVDEISAQGPPPPTEWRCARDSAARMDAYLQNHKSSLSDQQRWVRDLKAAQRRMQQENAQTSDNKGSGHSELSTASPILYCPNYISLMEVQLEGKRQHISHQRVSQQQRMTRQLGNLPRIDPECTQSAGIASSSGIPSSSMPTRTEAAQYIALADREFLSSIAKRVHHCQNLLSSKAKGNEEGAQEEAAAAEANDWAKMQLKSLYSDGSSALWFTATPCSPENSPSLAVDLSLYHSGNSRAIKVSAAFIRSYLRANGIPLSLEITHDNEKDVSAVHNDKESPKTALSIDDANAFSVTPETFGFGTVASYTSTVRSRFIRGLTSDHSPGRAMERRRVNLAMRGQSINNLNTATSVVTDCAVIDDYGPGKAVSALTLQPPSLVTRALGLIRYKSNPKLALHDQIILSAPEDSSIQIDEGDLLLLCNRGIFESEASGDISFAADGATVDAIVEAALEEMLNRATTVLCEQESAASSQEIANIASLIDPKAIAAAICDAGLENGTKNSLQVMVVAIPPKGHGSDIIKEKVVSDKFVEETSSPSSKSFEVLRMDLPASGGPVLLHHFIPGPIFPTHLRADPLFRLAFLRDLQRAGIEPSEWLRLRWGHLQNLFRTNDEGRVLPSYFHSDCKKLRGTNNALKSAYPSISAQLRHALAQEAALFQSRPSSLIVGGPSMNTYQNDYFRDIAMFLFGRR